MDLFEANRREQLADRAPLATRMRPRTLDELVGHQSVVGPGTLLRKAIEADRLSSIILWGPPGSGKTTLARIIATTTKAEFAALSAVTSGEGRRSSASIFRIAAPEQPASAPNCCWVRCSAWRRRCSHRPNERSSGSIRRLLAAVAVGPRIRQRDCSTPVTLVSRSTVTTVPSAHG
jgi:ATPase subunit of ABC transporter with duplicated ATPase domains